MGNSIHFLKEEQPCNAGIKMLADQMKLTHDQEANPFVPDSEEITDAAPVEMLMDEDEDEDVNIEII